MEIKSFLRKVYNFLWKEESIQSYIAFIIVSYILLRFLVYPGFLFIMGWKDIVSVLSSSMVHGPYINATYYFWMEQNGINYTEFPFPNGLNPGDAVVIVDANNISVGDVIVYVPEGYSDSIIHRVVLKKKYGDRYYYTTKGDANNAIGAFEINITEDRIVGKAVFSIPFLGYPRAILHNFFGI